MTFGLTADPQQLATMERVVTAYCKQARIARETVECENIAATVLALFNLGITDENELLAALISTPYRCAKKAGRHSNPENDPVPAGFRRNAQLAG